MLFYNHFVVKLSVERPNQIKLEDADLGRFFFFFWLLTES